MDSQTNNFLRFIFAIVLAWFAFLCSAMLHEWTHGFMAWIFHYKSNPFNIIYGGTSWQNLLYFANIDENVNYAMINLLGHPYQAALIAIMPPLVIDGGLALISGLYLRYKSFKNPAWTWFVFWIFIWNIGECFAYFILRVFSTHADLGHFLNGFNISPWWVFIPSLYILAFAFHFGLKTLLPRLFQTCRINDAGTQGLIFLCIIAVLIPFYAIRPLHPNYNPIVHMISYLSLLCVPVVLIAYWPRARSIFR